MNTPNRRVLIVDDNPSIHEDFRAILMSRDAVAEEFLAAEGQLFGGPPSRSRPYFDFEVESSYQGEDAVLKVMEAAHGNRPYAVAFIDMRMPPGWDGLETLQHLWEVDDRVEVVLCTAYSDRSVNELLETCGETDRLLIIKKPFEPDEVRLASISLTKKWQLARQAEMRRNELEHLVSQRTAEISLARDATVFALAKLAESRDPETGDHLNRMREYSQILAEDLASRTPCGDKITLEFLRDFYRSTPLHDIGKVGIPDAILLKPGRLTNDEFEIMKCHTVIGAETLEETALFEGEAGFLKMAAAIARSHHERFDGNGYPEGLHGEEIPLAARIVSVADVLDALTSRRVYKDAMPFDEAWDCIRAESGKQFDPFVVGALERCYDQLIEAKQRVDACHRVNSSLAPGLIQSGRSFFEQAVALTTTSPNA